jgi:hypothetical protein
VRSLLLRLLGLAAALGCAAAPLPAHAARPMITDDARLVDAKACQIESWVRVNRSRPHELWAVPSCNPTGNLELALGGAVAQDGTGLGRGTTLAQAKTLFRPLRTDDFGWGAVLGVARDPNIDPVGNLIDNIYAFIPASWSLAGDRVVLHANVGALHDRHERRTRGTWGLGTEIALFGPVQLIAESFGEGGSKPFRHAGLRIWLVPDRLQVDTTVGTRVGAGGADERWFTVGVRWISTPFLP